MKTLIKLFLVAVVVIVVVVLYYSDRNQHAHNVAQDLKDAAHETKDFLADKFNLSSNDIKDQIAKTGKVVWEKAESVASNPAFTDARITAAIKTKLAADSALSVLNISVSTSDGVVTLSGTSSSSDNIRKAMQIAINTDGVKKVISTLQLKE